MKIVVLESLGISDKEFNTITQPLTDDGHELVVHKDGKSDVETLKSRVKDAEVLVLANMPLKAEVIAAAEKLQYISVAFTGYDHIDLDKCKEKGIKVSNAAGYSTNSVAELTFGLIISLLRSVVPLEKIVREGGTKQGYRQTDLKGKTVGVVGTGDIGGTVAELALAFGCKVIAYNRSEKPELIKKGVVYTTLDELLQQSDIVTIHTPLTAETKGLINQEKLELMKSSAVLINTAVGPIVDNAALAQALHNGTIAGAGLDRVDMEPPVPADYPILAAPNTVLVPHIGFATEEAMIRRANITFTNISKWKAGAQENVIL
ncbi:NAD(P)-dependent oxidoreductase [Alcaligenes endophyticus]|uniref:NAD(P)-binding domain-containing protein n=1 Tax=Alcaligenes endophyticus TaxID=1929088 RepID=A0ABT8EJS1_9BURK|nr:NAD(P)-dependent oxidoreductase [Alcaligenes endophyticus]MCX5591849.1 NAD(P)-binding domain-containing protein [Alcaligenes endophyticus]MDN4121539.1 NAD(P)-binding domain-containing protein [Alcaligenes endophyticus]